MYKVTIKKAALKSLKNLPLKTLLGIREKVLELAENPRPVGYKKLKSYHNLFRVRYSDYRIVYSIFDEILTIEIINIAKRSDVYKSL